MGGTVPGGTLNVLTFFLAVVSGHILRHGCPRVGLHMVQQWQTGDCLVLGGGL